VENPGVDEQRCDHGPRHEHGQNWLVKQVARDQISTHILQSKNDHRDNHQRYCDHRTTTRVAVCRKTGRATRGRFARFPHAAGAVNAHGRLCRALRAKGSPAALTQNVADSLGMPITRIAHLLSRIGHPSYLQFFDGDALNDHVTQRLVATIGGDSLDRVNDSAGILVSNDAKNGVLRLKPGGRHGRDEKL
jgi:hypothetical protein